MFTKVPPLQSLRLSQPVRKPRVCCFPENLFEALQNIQSEWIVVVTILAALTMTVGNLVAIAQRNIKRMLAYSSIAPCRIRLGWVSCSQQRRNLQRDVLSACLLHHEYRGIWSGDSCENRRRRESHDFRLCRSRVQKPLLALFMTLMLLSLAGFPPTAGFVGKFYIFRSAVESGQIWLVIIGAINTAISAFYYLRVVVWQCI